MANKQNPYRSPFPKTALGSSFLPVTGHVIGICVSVFPAILMLVLFYSLALHMYFALGAWPNSIGTEGFPAVLSLHAWIAGMFCSILILICLAWPFAFLACNLIRPWNFLMKYLGAFAVSCLGGAFVMSFAPSPFLYWWWD